MVTYNLIDSNFFPDKWSSKEGWSDLIYWDRSLKTNSPTVITDFHLKEHDKIKGQKVAWLLEPRSVHPQIYKWIWYNNHLFNEIWTHEKHLLNEINNSRWVPMAGTWIEEKERFIKPKSKLISLIASTKNKTIGHRMRNMIRKKVPDYVDKFGNGTKNTIKNKTQGLSDYAFSIAIENSQIKGYFTEKIIDCFLTGTIPVYWGAPDIEDYFDKNGIIIFQGENSLMNQLNKLDFNLYNNKIKAIRNNFNIAKNYLVGEEWATIN